MFIIQPEGEIVKGTKTLSKQCEHCGNVTDHFVWKQPYGFQVGTIFSRRKTLGMKKYYLVCPVCKQADRELTREQALNMKS
ncbi:hypothetical protein H6775_01445 [Candidatus Nomurabacteria bacterium]|nr:hypothetical protein [Candidatus Nomurabacteria bacterium]